MLQKVWEQAWPKAKNYRRRESWWPPSGGKGTNIALPGCGKARDKRYWRVGPSVTEESLGMSLIPGCTGS